MFAGAPRRRDPRFNTLMGAQQDALTALLREAGMPAGSPSRPNAEAIRHLGLADEVHSVYRQVGGQSHEPKLLPGAWDITCENVIVELDEQRHFNRYRATTLEAATYKRCWVVDVPEYLEFCASFEGECLRSARHGGYWTNPSAEKEFGPSGPTGELEGAGAARWRQRAFYDYVKDAYASASGLPLVRIAIWEKIDNEHAKLTVGRALKLLARRPDEDLAGRTLAHVLRRMKLSQGASPVSEH